MREFTVDLEGRSEPPDEQISGQIKNIYTDIDRTPTLLIYIWTLQGYLRSRSNSMGFACRSPETDKPNLLLSKFIGILKKFIQIDILGHENNNFKWNKF